MITGPKSFLVVEFSASFDFLSSGGRGGNASAAHEKYSSRCFSIQGLSPIARPGRFLARSNSHPVVARSDCTNILLAAAGLRRTRPFSRAAFRPSRSAVRPPGSARTDRALEDFSSLVLSGRFHHGSLDNDTSAHIFPQRHQQLARQRHDGLSLMPATIECDPLFEPQSECRFRLMAHP